MAPTTEAADTPAAKKGIIKEFKEFISRGNMIELAVGVILGAAIGLVIKAFTDGIMMQIVAAIFGKPNFDDVTIVLRHNVATDETGASINAELQIGTFINAVIALVLTGLVLFAIIKMYNRLKRQQAVDEPDPGPTEIELLTEIRDALRTQS